MRTGIMITARMESGRFPGKVMAPLAGRPVLGHLIDKAKHAAPDVVVVSTSRNQTSDAIAQFCRAEGVDCVRGPEDDLQLRREMTVGICGLTHWIDFSGDCPFIDVRAAELILATMREEPLYDAYSPTFYPSGALGIMCSGMSLPWLEKIRSLLDLEPEWHAAHLEQPWCVTLLNPGVYSARFSTRQIDTHELYDATKTPMNLCIDYPLQLWVANILVDRLGHFPHDFREMEKAYREIDPVSEGWKIAH